MKTREVIPVVTEFNKNIRRDIRNTIKKFVHQIIPEKTFERKVIGVLCSMRLEEKIIFLGSIEALMYSVMDALKVLKA